MAVEQNSIRWRERYYAARPASAVRVSPALADAVSEIDSPVVKLRFLRDVIDHHRSIPQPLRYRVIRPLRRAFTRLATFTSQFARSTQRQIHTWVGRALLLAVCGCAIVIVTMRLTAMERVLDKHAASINKALVASSSASAVPRLAPVAETLTVDTQGVAPTTIWLADHGSNWELYSNGLRIETAYSVRGEPRSFRVHDINTGLKPELHSKPIGILFHTSESDIWPLDTDFEKQLRSTSEALLEHVKRHQSYNYVIDRFGRVFRIVDDETRANHAGYGVWTNNDEVYLDLNSAFLGVSFESRWAGGKTLPITRAQLVAGRNLTHYLRQRFAIAPEMCVTHGLTSVSPKSYLIGFHKDWARGFPFAAFGLPDQYAVIPPSMKIFGFGYDSELAQVVGSGWPGAMAGKSAFTQAANTLGMSPETLRNQRRTLYLKWFAEARVADPNTGDSDLTLADSRSELSTHLQ